MTSAAPPFDTWPEQLVEPRFGRAWFTYPATFVNQLSCRHATVDTVTALHDTIEHVLRRYRQEIAGAGGLTFIHDWRQLRGYDSEARRIYLERMRARPPGYLKLAVTIVGDTPLLRMAVQTANILMALRNGGQLEIATDAVAVLTRHNVQPPTGRGWR